MSSNEEFNESPVSHYQLLFKKSSYRSEWNEKSPERSSIFSISPDEVGNLVRSQELFDQNLDAGGSGGTLPGSSFLPTMVRFQPRPVSYDIPVPSYCSSYSEDSLEESTAKTMEAERNGEETEIEGDTLEGHETTNQELEDEESCKNEDDNPVDYLDKEVFPVLLPCLEKMLFAAKENNVLKSQKSSFNGLDYLAELLWNCNPLHPERHSSYVTVFNIPFVQQYLEENPRPLIPQSWLWTRDQAAIMIQSAFRGYLVRCQPQVQEMRQFWKTLAEEKLVNKSETLTEVKQPVEKSTIIEVDNSSRSYSFYSQQLDGKS